MGLKPLSCLPSPRRKSRKNGSSGEAACAAGWAWAGRWAPADALMDRNRITEVTATTGILFPSPVRAGFELSRGRGGVGSVVVQRSVGEVTGGQEGVPDNRVVRSRLLPGGDLVRAVLDRRVMILADRGGASGMVGRRWADVCAATALDWPGQRALVPDDEPTPFVVKCVARLDDVPQIAAAASKRGLQNPDLLLIGARGGRPALQAADAKFSVETARSKQVSPPVVAALLGLGDLLRPLVGELAGLVDLLPGVFLSPDFPLTELMLRGRHGILRATVDPREVILVPTLAASFFAPLEGASLMPILAGLDALPLRVEASLLAGLYYFRLSRAAIGCWLDAVKPLLLFNDRVAVDEAAVRAEAGERAPTAPSAFDLVLGWNDDVESVRAQRAAVDQVTGLPVIGKDLRTLVAKAAAHTGGEAPSMNQVRRRLAAWYRGQIRKQVGPLLPPVADLPTVLGDLSRIGASLGPQLDSQVVRIVNQLVTQRMDGADGGAGVDSDEQLADG